MTKVWKTRKVKTELKSNKSADNPDSNKPINLLCIPYKLFERLIYNRIKSVIKSVLPKEQAGFRPNHYTLDQVSLLQPSFDKKLKTGVVLVDLSAAYDTICHCGLTLKLLKTILEMVRTIIGMISQCHFYVHIGKSKSRCRTLLNGV